MRNHPHEVISWVVGRGGLLGRSVESALLESTEVWDPIRPTRWEDHLLASADLDDSCKSFAQHVSGRQWQIAWCAGTGVVASKREQIDIDTVLFASFLKSVAAHLHLEFGGKGALFFASSAGGMYAGSKNPPFTEFSKAAPLAPYGMGKARQEELLKEWSREHGIPVLIGRISNLYGPGQNSSKAQGLITQLCLRSITRRSLVLYVPLDTTRDFLYVDDAARLIDEGLSQLRVSSPSPSESKCVTKIIASHHPVTIATLLGTLRAITKKPVRITVAASPEALVQSRDLRLESKIWTHLDKYPVVSLSDGMHRVLESLITTLADGKLSF